MSGIEQAMTAWLTEASQHPLELYTTVILLLTLSSFGLPFPEEIVLLTSGYIANIALNESLASGDAPKLSPENLALVCFFAVLLSDALVFSLGRRYGTGLVKSRLLGRFFNQSSQQRIQSWTEKYGAWACGIFRFTPALRFPGHFMCGAVGISYTRFFLVDGLAALFSVPTQVLLMAYYGDEILVYIKQFKLGLLVMLGLGVLFWLGRRLRRKALA